jgi:hypothetical protein
MRREGHKVKILRSLEEVYALEHGTYVIQGGNDFGGYVQVLQFYGWDNADGTPSIGVLDFGDEMGGDARWSLKFPLVIVWSEQQSNRLAKRFEKGEFDL